MISPLANATLFHIGPAPITSAVVVTWGLMAFLVGGAVLVNRRLSLDPSPTQSVFELIVDTVDGQIRDTMQVEPARYRAFIGTLFIFIFAANWSTLIPGVEPPTAHLETDIALAFLVFIAVIVFGIRAGGLRHYLATFASPSPIMIRTSSSIRRNSGDVRDLTFARATTSASLEAAAIVSSHCATSTGEYFGFGLPASRSCVNSTTVEKICGSSGLTVPKHRGAGVSL